MLRFFCSVFVVFTLLCVTLIATFAETHTTARNGTDVVSNNCQVNDGINSNTLPLRSIRYRRQHPTIKKNAKHIIRTTKRTNERRGVKRPKIKYGPPNYNFGEPIVGYNPPYTHLERAGVGVAGSGSGTIYTSLHHFNQLNLESADFELPPCSYETQSMDLDFYSSDTPFYDYPRPPQTQSFNKYAEDFLNYQENIYNDVHRPHRKYGTPSTTDYSGARGHESLVYKTRPETQKHYIMNKDRSSNSEEVNYPTPPTYEPLHPPATSYGVPVRNCKPESIHLNTYLSNTAVVLPAYQTPTFDQSHYKLDDKNIRNSGYFASDDTLKEPQPTEIQITYSPSYQIDLNEGHGNNFGGDFAEPPANIEYEMHIPESQQPTTMETFHQPSECEDSRIYTQPTQELPLNPNQVRPCYDFPKTSYEVPIYDPVPSEASNTDERHERYPPHISQHPVEIPIIPEMKLSHLNTRPRQRNGVSGNNFSTSTTKHILDVPELKQAFEAEHSNQGFFYRTFANTNESDPVEQLQEQSFFKLTVLPKEHLPLHNRVSHPKRVRTASAKHFLPSTLINVINNNSNNTTKQHKFSQKHLIGRRPLLPKRSLPSSKKRQYRNNVMATHPAEISIQKSHSQSFYMGPILLPSYTPNLTTTKRTTNSIFDATIFQSPRNNFNNESNNIVLKNGTERMNERTHFIGILPPNHKYF